MSDSIHHSSSSDEWATPARLFSILDQEFAFTIDVAASPSNTKCKRFLTKEEDGLTLDWGTEVVWCNPPYSDVASWVEKVISATARGATVVLLVASRTDTRWYQTCLRYASEARLLQGKVRFGGARNAAPFPSTVFVFHASLAKRWATPDGDSYMLPRKQRHTYPWSLVQLGRGADE